MPSYQYSLVLAGGPPASVLHSGWLAGWLAREFPADHIIQSPNNPSIGQWGTGRAVEREVGDPWAGWAEMDPKRIRYSFKTVNRVFTQ